MSSLNLCTGNCAWLFALAMISTGHLSSAQEVNTDATDSIEEIVAESVKQESPEEI